MAVTVTKVDLLRHGACEGGEIFRGSTDVALSETGWQQMREKAAFLEGSWDRILSSPLQRCRNFATELSGDSGLPLSIHDDFREMHFGDWEGLPHAEAQQRFPEHWRQFWQTPAQLVPPNGEAMADFSDRVTAELDRVVAEHTGQSLLLVVHGAVIRVMICHWLGMPLDSVTRLSVPYAGHSRFEIYQQPGRPPWVQLHSHG